MYLCARDNWEAAKLVVALEKVIWAINWFKPYKSPGMNGIIPIFHMKDIDILAPILCKIFKSCIAYKYISLSLRYTEVVFVPKTRKDYYLEVKSFRYISLISLLLKAIQNLVERYIRNCVLTIHCLSHSMLRNLLVLLYMNFFSRPIKFEHLSHHIIESWELQHIPVRYQLNFASNRGLLE